MVDAFIVTCRGARGRIDFDYHRYLDAKYSGLPLDSPKRFFSRVGFCRLIVDSCDVMLPEGESKQRCCLGSVAVIVSACSVSL